ncbi:MAG: nuclear transport factor 2 family protein [Candidatus Thiodiazotropha endolucinida]
MKIDKLVDWYQRLSPSSLNNIGEFYHESASFQDPFNRVQGSAQIAALLQHMFDTTESPGFIVKQIHIDGDVTWISWIFCCGLRGRKLTIEGASQLVLLQDGRIIRHRDYWDAADLYQQLPLIGTMIRMLKRRFKVKTGCPSPGKLLHER